MSSLSKLVNEITQKPICVALFYLNKDNIRLFYSQMQILNIDHSVRLSLNESAVLVLCLAVAKLLLLNICIFELKEKYNFVLINNA